ncbi:hypothetical protein ACG33_03680 [Steroidobacter denitrificans]|uniref:FecR family protein n=1 Tax=Steroidobacter denitrificans TaxID=465721 RepID=A0A127F9F0_STEDE|nr:FecR domain-containing protein [Steroidobacter denitrificans]AMN46220.1 hypothetical protein ACG33_03680 [Steroidobacter denitrificans]
MSNIQSRRISPAVKAEAAVWFARLRSEERRREDEVSFRAWLSEDVRHREAFELVTMAWDTAGELVVPIRLYRHSQRLQLMSRRALTLGGAVALASFAGVGLWRIVAADAYATGVGEQRRIALDDGSYVILDTNTRIRVAFTKTRRDIELIEGRAYFEVATDPLRPFLVRAGDRQVIAIGTAFDVAFEESRLAVVLVEGRVAVQPITLSPQPVTRVLSPGERIVFDRAREIIKDQPDLAQVTAWQSGRVVFDDQTLAEAVTEMNRYSRRPIVIADEQLAAFRISGVYSTGDPESFARSVSILLPAQVELTPMQIVLRAAEES